VVGPAGAGPTILCRRRPLAAGPRPIRPRFDSSGSRRGGGPGGRTMPTPWICRSGC